MWTYLAPEHTVLLTTPNGSKLSEPDKPKRTAWSNARLKWSTVTRAHAPRQVAYTCGQGGAFETVDTVRAALGRLSALSVFPMKINFVWGVRMGAQGAYPPKTAVSGPGSARP